MSQNIPEIAEMSGGVPSSEHALASGPSPRQENPLLKLHQIFSGRYHWAILLGAVLGAIGGLAAHFTVKNLYQSYGAIQIKPYLTRVIYNSELNSVMPMFDSYVDTQASILQSQRTLSMAMEDANWKAAVSKAKPYDLGIFTDSLRVSHPSNSEEIIVSFTDEDPKVAPVAVKAVIDAYMRLADENDADGYANRLKILEDRRTTLTGQLKGYNDRILGIANEFGTDDLERVYGPKLEEFNRLQSSLAEADIMLAYVHADANAASAPSTAPSTAPGATSTTAPATQAQPLTPEIVASRDENMKRLLAERDQEEENLASLRLTQGEAQPAVRGAVARLGIINAAIEKRLAQYQAASTQPSMAPDGTGSMLDSSADALRKQEERRQAEFRVAELKARMDQVKAEMLDIGRKELQIRSIKLDIESVQKNLDDTKERIEQLNVESAVSGRIHPIDPDMPFRPVKDKNRQMTIVGSLGGLFLGFAIIGLIGLSDRRLKSVADAQRFADRSNRLLGILPALPEDLTDPAQAATAAYCVHHIRTLLQLGNGSVAHPVIAVTSASPGEGKTSLVLSLGHSYAAAGAKTLLIDFDIIGTGLTTRSNAVVHRRLRDILLRDKVITREQLDQALAFASRSGKQLAETLLELKLLEPSALKAAQTAKRESSLGLLDVLDGEPLANCVKNGTKNLSILPMGNIDTQHPGQVSLAQVQRIMKEARQSYDVVLVDTGPVLGSLESCIVTAVADEVILVVARGQVRPMISKAFARLSEVNAKLAGIVFNRAGEDDIENSAYSSYRTSRRTPLLDDDTGSIDDPSNPALPEANGKSNGRSSNGSLGKHHRLGPVAQSVIEVEIPDKTHASDAP